MNIKNEKNTIGNSVSQRLHNALREIILNSKPGERLPSEPVLSAQLGVSRATLREAMRTFETQGMIRRRQGSGTYITRSSHVIESGLEILESLTKLADRIGMPVKVGELTIETRSATQEECESLHLDQESLVTQVSRVIWAEDRPVAYLVDILPENILADESLKENFSGSVLDLLLKDEKLSPYLSRTEISADTASSDIAKLLGVQRGAVLLRFIADLYSTNGHPLDHSYSYFLPGYFRFHVVRKVGL